jgi:ribosomal protein S21
MAVNVKITKKNNENSVSVLKRFSRRVQESGVIQKVKSKRYAERLPSDYTKKKNKLKSLKKKAEFQSLFKLGKISATPTRR